MLTSKAMTGEKSMTFMMLPNDLIFNCLARVSRLYYPALSLVSKRFRSFLVSLELYETRRFLGRTESILYVCLPHSYESHRARWFTLFWKPAQITNPNPNPLRFTSRFTTNSYKLPTNQTRKKLSNLNLSLGSTLRPRFYMGCSPAVVALGCNIYEIGGPSRLMSSSWVSFMDCRSHTWHNAPSMQMKRMEPHVTVFDGKIYVVGGVKDCDSSNWIEFFDPETQRWEYLPCPAVEVLGKARKPNSLAIQGKLYLFGDKKSFVVYYPKENRWDDVGVRKMTLEWVIHRQHSCVVENVLYKFGFSTKLEWYDFQGRCWRNLKGLEKLFNLPKGYDRVTLTGYGGKLAVLWIGNGEEIWCAEIALERRNGNEVHGKVEWCHVVHKLPITSIPCHFLNFVAVTV